MTIDIDKALSVTSKEYGVLLKLCLNLTLFFRETDPSTASRLAFLDILDEHARLTGDKYRWTLNPTTERWVKLKAGINSYAHPRDWLPEAKDTRWVLDWHAGEQRSDASDIEVFSFLLSKRAIDLSFLQLQFPVAQFDGQFSGLPELAQKFCARLKPEHGYGGFRLAQSHAYEDGAGAKYCLNLTRRFSGLDVGSAMWDSTNLTKGIKGAGWLTVLSDAYTEKLGGEEAVRNGAQGLGVLPYEGGLIIQAGVMPLVGDREKFQDMSAYKQAAKLVEPIRCKNSGSGFSDSHHGFTRDPYRAWLARFSPQPE